MHAPVIEVDSLSKRFCRNLRRSMLYGVRDIFSDAFGRGQGEVRLRPDEFWAVDDVTVAVPQGGRGSSFARVSSAAARTADSGSVASGVRSLRAVRSSTELAQPLHHSRPHEAPVTRQKYPRLRRHLRHCHHPFDL